MGPYPVGFDPIAFYVPMTLDWSSKPAGPMTMLGTAPLLFLISVPIYRLAHVSPVWIFKFLGPFLYGSMIWALYRFLKLGLGWPEKSALLGGIFTSIYFVTLRIGWDLFRTVLSLIFLLLLVPILMKSKPHDRPLLQTLLLGLIILSDQLTGILALAILGTLIVMDLWNHDYELAGRRTPQFLIGSAILSAVTFAFFFYPTSYFPIPNLGPAVFGLPLGVLFLPYAFLPLSPLVLFGVKQKVTFEVKSWILICMLLTLVTALPFTIFRETSYRWVLLMDIPVCIVAFAGLERTIASMSQIKRPRFLGTLKRVGYPAIFISLGIVYITLPANLAMPYYTQFPRLIPTSMVQNTVPSYDMNSIVQCLNWVADRNLPGTALITHQVFYGWARAYFAFPNEIIDYQFGSPQSGASQATALGYSRIYMIWWVEGTGWYYTPFVTSGFVVVHIEGNIAVYYYQS